MQASTARKLSEINQRFYSEFGASFSATRQRLQPGVRRVISTLAGDEHILDLGCGNGEFARCLAQNQFRGQYLGLDFSPPLLGDASDQPAGFPAAFRQADLSAPDWDAGLAPAGFSLVTAFAVLHHIPSVQLRREILQKIRHLLAPGGKFIHSNWQFLNSEKLKTRIQPWELAGLGADDLDAGDYLLDWRGGGAGLRYVHHFSAPELEQLALETGFRVAQTFLSDGDGGRLGLYQLWESS